jgi:hypothetical protein
MSAADWEATGYGLCDELRCGNSVDIPVDDFWQISGISGRNRGDIHRFRGRERIAKPLVRQGFSSLVLSLIPWLKGISNLVPSTTRPPLRIANFACNSAGLRSITMPAEQVLNPPLFLANF